MALEQSHCLGETTGADLNANVVKTLLEQATKVLRPGE
jgi:hypothetical protein